MDATKCILECQVDWLTLTLPAPTENSPLIAYGYQILETELKNGNVPRPFSFKGYVGAHCGCVSYGSRDDGTLLQVTGPAANAHFRGLCETKGRASRIDVQVTANMGPNAPRYADLAYEQILHSTPREGRRVKGTIYRNTDGGQTCYVGSPASDHRGRIYDKARESENPYYDQCWRWEVETRGKLAERLREALAKADDLVETACAYVWTWFRNRSIGMPWDARSLFALAPAPTPRSDYERQIQWLSRQVRPTVDYLSLQGHRKAVMMALGLDG